MRFEKKDNTDQNLKKPFINDFGCFCFISIITVNCSLCQIFHVKSQSQTMVDYMKKVTNFKLIPAVKFQVRDVIRLDVSISSKPRRVLINLIFSKDHFVGNQYKQNRYEICQFKIINVYQQSSKLFGLVAIEKPKQGR